MAGSKLTAQGQAVLAVAREAVPELQDTVATVQGDLSGAVQRSLSAVKGNLAAAQQSLVSQIAPQVAQVTGVAQGLTQQLTALGGATAAQLAATAQSIGPPGLPPAASAAGAAVPPPGVWATQGPPDPAYVYAYSDTLLGPPPAGWVDPNYGTYQALSQIFQPDGVTPSAPSNLGQCDAAGQHCRWLIGPPRIWPSALITQRDLTDDHFSLSRGPWHMLASCANPHAAQALQCPVAPPPAQPAAPAGGQIPTPVPAPVPAQVPVPVADQYWIVP